jgi:undecaprenyl-diphosphatase
MLDKILSLDTELLIFLNGLGSERFDNLWLIITTTLLDSFFLFSFIKKLGKTDLVFFLAIAVLITFTDQMTNLFKNGFQRLRPCSNPKSIQ